MTERLRRALQAGMKTQEAPQSSAVAQPPAPLAAGPKSLQPTADTLTVPQGVQQNDSPNITTQMVQATEAAQFSATGAGAIAGTGFLLSPYNNSMADTISDALRHCARRYSAIDRGEELF